MTVYCSDRVLGLGLPPHTHFSKSSASFVLHLIKSAHLMLQYKQQHMQKSGHEDDQNLIYKLTGEGKDLFPLFSNDTTNWHSIHV